jgi:hypothetical protein
MTVMYQSADPPPPAEPAPRLGWVRFVIYALAVHGRTATAVRTDRR